MHNSIEKKYLTLDPRWSTTRRLAVDKSAARANDKRHEAKGETAGGMRLRGLLKEHSDDHPLLSIVTVVYNNKKHLRRCIESVLLQNYDNVEYIIIDGGSTDGSLDILREYDQQLDYWHSAKDNGIYDAMNQGINLARGSLVGIINSDDWYTEGIFAEIVSEHQKHPQAILHGNMVLEKDDRKYCTIEAPANLNKLAKGMILNHPTVFLPSRLYREHGVFDTDYKIVADWELIVRLWRRGASFQRLSFTIAHFRLGGISYEYDRRQVEEKHAVRRKHNLYGGFDKHYLLDRIKLLIPSRLLMKISLLKQKISSRCRGW